MAKPDPVETVQQLRTMGAEEIEIEVRPMGRMRVRCRFPVKPTMVIHSNESETGQPPKIRELSREEEQSQALDWSSGG